MKSAYLFIIGLSATLSAYSQGVKKHIYSDGTQQTTGFDKPHFSSENKYAPVPATTKTTVNNAPGTRTLREVQHDDSIAAENTKAKAKAYNERIAEEKANERKKETEEEQARQEAEAEYEANEAKRKREYAEREAQEQAEELKNLPIPFKDGKGKIGFKLATKKIIIPAKYDEVSGMFRVSGTMDTAEDGYEVAVKLNGKWGLIDKTGATISPFVYDSCEAYPYQERSTKWRMGFRVYKDKKWGILLMRNYPRTPMAFDTKPRIYRDIAFGNIDGKMAYYDCVKEVWLTKADDTYENNYPITRVNDVIEAEEKANGLK